MTTTLLEPGQIGPVQTRNRIVRAGTSETMAGPEGEVTPQLLELYRALAAGGVGLIITGHLYCERRGQYTIAQTGIHNDRLVPGLRRLTDVVHACGGRILAQIAHAGSQSRVLQAQPLAPSPVPNELTGRQVAAANDEEIEAAIEAFAAGAHRAAEAGFDGVHIHGANGYLISEFCSPVANRREDRWGGSPQARDRFPLEVVRRVRSALPTGMAMTMKLGCADALPSPDGLTVRESANRAVVLVAAGLDAIEVSCNLMRRPTDSAASYVAVDTVRALRDGLVSRVGRPPHPEAYFLPWCRTLREHVDVPLILVGGMRTRETMEALLRDRECAFIAMARPFIREPDLAAQLARGRTGPVDCTSCNLCLMHEGQHSLRCWRTPRLRLLQHAAYRFSGGFNRAATIKVRWSEE